MKYPLMPKATAIWLVENTALTFNQIAEFCGLHELEVQGIADGDVAVGMRGYDPIDNNQLTKAMMTVVSDYDKYKPKKLKSIAQQFSMDSIGKKINQEYLSALN